MNFEHVAASELAEVYALYQATIEEMHARDLYQWTWGRYPREELLTEDVALGRLYWLKEEGAHAAVFAVCVGQDPEYDGIPWQYGIRPGCLHRLALHPAFAGKGLGRAIVAFAKEEALRLGCDCFRVDTYGQNERALKLFSGVTAREAGTFRLPWYPDVFHCFEAPLTATCPLLPVRMHPAYRYGEQTPWGGDALRRLYGKAIPDDRTGEALEISCIPGLESTDDQGEPLSALLAQNGARLAGEGNAEPFPLLLKLLAAKSNLSVQVHPNDAYAMAHEHKLGKTEAWVILDAEPGAMLSYGLKDGVTLAALEAALTSGEDVEPMIASVSVTAGDVLYMPSGMVHAIGGGITLYEIQQSSDVTYRLWDYRRVNGKGETRPLHIRQSLDVIDPKLQGLRTRIPDAADIGEHTVLSVPAFTVICLCVAGELSLTAHEKSFRMFTALNALTLCWQGGQLELTAGESALIPARAPALMLRGQGRTLVSSVN
ncbi:MAG TPA: GNAT family N-acetyltransferase [Candidatus Limiplasma sp.]|nr:GNAT family N-acetyltransferase [Candidatus Limiplasma sp.]HPS82451.1 GNAT family N-acetyltransferase [Candidatus Limiplasma sp.]